ncbi:MAG: hypothetical protein ACI391_07925 [Muribaculaceae bacterium]
MKKIYTLFAAAAVAMSATAAVPVLEPHQIAVPSMQLHHNLSTLSLQSPAQVNRPAKAPKANAAAAASVADFENLYLQECFSVYEGWSINGLVMIGDMGEGVVGIDGFCWEDVPLTGGVFDPATQTITFPAQDTGLTVQTEDGSEYKLMITLVDINQTTYKFSLSTDDIVFNVDLENRNIWYMGEQGTATWAQIIGMCAFDANGNFAGLFDGLGFVDFNVVNSYCSYSYLANSTDTELTENYDYIYTEIQGNNLVAYNVLGGGFSFPVPFAVDATAMTATVTDAVVSQQQDESGSLYDFYLFDVAIDDQSASLVGTTLDFSVMVVDDQEGGYLTGIGKEYCACGTDYQGQFVPLFGNGLISGLTVVYQGDLIADMAGVKDITIDVDNSNAPVEYFNLQGQRVSGHLAPGIYIRRQGSEAGKVRF